MNKSTAGHTVEILPQLRRKYLLSRVQPESLKMKEVGYTEL
jgi:hypothetical protein